jgi:hypothetical protein
MPTAPNTDNYTVPGGIKLFVDTGSGERDLGNIVEIDLEPGSDVLEHFTNRPGKRTKDKEIVLEDKLMINFTMDEPNLENMRLFFRGGDDIADGIGRKMPIASLASIEGTVRMECFPSTGRGISWELYFGKASIKSKGAMKLDDKTWMPVPMVIEVLNNEDVDATYPFGWYKIYESAPSGSPSKSPSLSPSSSPSTSPSLSPSVSPST